MQTFEPSFSSLLIIGIAHTCINKFYVVGNARKKLSTHVPLPIPATFGSRRADRDSFTFIFIGCGYFLVRIAFALWPCREWILDALDLRKQDVFVVRSRFRQTGLIERRHKCQLPALQPKQLPNASEGMQEVIEGRIFHGIDAT